MLEANIIGLKDEGREEGGGRGGGKGLFDNGATDSYKLNTDLFDYLRFLYGFVWLHDCHF